MLTRFSKLLILLGLLAMPAFGQYSSQVAIHLGSGYAQGAVTISLLQPALSPVVATSTFLDTTGSTTILTLLQGRTYSFLVCEFNGTGCLYTTIVINGAGQDITAALEANPFGGVGSSVGPPTSLQEAGVSTGSFTNGPLSGQALAQYAGYTIGVSTSSTCATFNPGGTYVCARNNFTGTIDYYGSDFAVVWHNVIAAMTSNGNAGGHILIKVGTYPINSLYTSGSIAYGLGVPSQCANQQGCQWLIEGEASTEWAGESSLPVQTGGVIFDVTPTAVASVSSTTVIAGEFTLPQTSAFTDVFIRNIHIRFPNNQRGYEINFDNYNANNPNYDNDLADFNEAYSSLAAPSTNTPFIGFTTSTSGQGMVQHITRSYAVGMDTCFAVDSEHSTLDIDDANYCRYAAKVGYTGSQDIYTPIKFFEFNDQENMHGVQLGPNMASGSRVDMIGRYIEIATSGTFARVSDDYETNQGYTSGIWTYTYFAQEAPFATPKTNIFSQGGQNIQTFDGTTGPAISRGPATYSCTQPNATSLGSPWTLVTGLTPAGITSNACAATVAPASSAEVYAARSFNNDQFAYAYVASTDSTGDVEVTVRQQQAGTAQTYYHYYCGGAGGSGSGIGKTISGTLTVLASNAGRVCSAGDKIELDVVGSSLIAYYTPNGGSPTVDLGPVTDTSLTSGAPGFVLYSPSTPTGDTIANWTGGSLPTKTGADSVASGNNLLTGLNQITTYNINNIVWVDGKQYAKTDVGIQAAVTALGDSPGAVMLSAGSYSLANPVAVTNTGQRIICPAGMDSSYLNYTGSATITAVLDYGTSATGTANQEYDGLNGCTVNGNGKASNALRVRGVLRSDFSHNRFINVTEGAIHTYFAILDMFDDEHTSSNEPGWIGADKPSSCIILDGISSSYPSTFSTVKLPVCEGVSGSGIKLGQAAGIKIISGTSEGNNGGIEVDSTASSTDIDAVDMESNTSFDVQIQGTETKIEGETNATNLIHVMSGAAGTHIDDGLYNSITIDSGAVDTEMSHFGYGSEGGTITDNGTSTSKYLVHNLDGDAYDSNYFSNSFINFCCVAFSAIRGAASANTFSDGNYSQNIQWAPTSNSQTGFAFGESSAATNGTLGNQFLGAFATQAGSTEVPLHITDSLTGSQTLPALYIVPSWNTSGVVDAALLINAINTASGSGSKLIDAQTNAASEFSVDKAGNGVFAGSITVSSCTGCGGGGSSLFTSFQLGSNTAITGTGQYLQITTDSNFANTYSGSGTSGSPFIYTFKLASNIAVGSVTASSYGTAANCSSSASPAVCGSAAAGSVAIPTGTNPTLQVNTSAVTANSQIILTIDESLGTKLGVTCNTTLTTLPTPVVTARSAGTSFTIQINATLATNVGCVSYSIIN